MKLLLIEPYYTGSHASWAEGLIKHSRHNISMLKLPGRHWKWRMHGGAVTLAKRYLTLREKPDLIIATDMMDLACFLSLTRRETSSIPVYLYFHENQLTYPQSPLDTDIPAKRDRHYAFINYSSALCADMVFFNSRFHKDSFIGSLHEFLNQFPDNKEIKSIEAISKKCRLLPLGVDLRRLEKHSQRLKKTGKGAKNDEPVILWNHRWEYDKNPSAFFNALYKLMEKGRSFKVAVLGRNNAECPLEFREARKRLGKRIIKFGYAESTREYAQWLWKSDIIPITSIQDFFGISLVEALYCGCIPCLPQRLAYPEIVPVKEFGNFYYNDDAGFLQLLEKVLSENHYDSTPFRQLAAQYDWENIIELYDKTFEGNPAKSIDV